MPTHPLQFGQYYHIYNRGNNSENLFVQERSYAYFLRLYTKYILPVAETYCYCLMSNHFHFLIRTRTEDEQRSLKIGPFLENGPIFEKIPKTLQPSRAFNNLFIAYARAFNKVTDRTGVLFETPFHRKLITTDTYFQRLVIYIHKNPQKHGFVEDFRTWKWSSFGALSSNRATRLERTIVLDWFGGHQSFNELHQQAIDEAEIVALVGDDEDW